MNSAERTAAFWIARLQAPDRSAADEADWRRWIAASRANADAFERLSLLWELVPASAASLASASAPAPRVKVLTRRRMLTGMAAGAATLGSAAIGLEAACAETRITTGIGERKAVRLHDGSSVVLDAATRVTAGGWPDYRRLRLDEGRIELAIARAASAFALTIGDSVVRAAAGRFDLQRDGKRSQAMVSLEGDARVLAPTGVRTVGVGQRWIADAAGDRIDRPDLAATRAWRAGQAVFHADSVATAVREANRYCPTPIRLGDDDVGGLRISGRYRMGDNLALARALATIHGLRVHRDRGAIWLEQETGRAQVG